ncbi:MAG TPA: DUF885 family protein [Candidatus Dormibacteraeota bacterium]
MGQTESERDPGGADQRFRALFTQEWEWRLRQLPDGEDGQLPIADHLPHVDPGTEETRLNYWEEILAELDRIPRAELAPANQTSFDVYRAQLEVLLARQRFRQFEMPANSDSAFWTDLGYTARRRFDEAADYENWISQMEDLPRYFEEQKEEMRAGLRRGFTPPRVTLGGRDASLTGVLTASPEENLFYTPFRDISPSVPRSAHADLRRRAAEVISAKVQPAYQQLLTFFQEEDLPGTRTTLAARELPDGEAYYASLLQEFTTLDLTPAQVHEIGLAEIERLEVEMSEVVREVGFGGGLAQFLIHLREDPRFYAKTPAELLSHAAWIAKVFDGKASRYFGRLPRRRFTIRPVPDDLAPFYTSGRGGPDEYLVNTYDLAHRPLYNLAALTLHESAPGHSFQMSLALEETSLPDFRRHTYISAFGEGWALYCEWLGVEMDIYETPYQRFGMLGYQSWRAARLVVDTGIHTMGWTRARALEYLQDHTALPHHEVETEIDRYIAMPAQALAYYLGEMRIRELRSRAESALGSSFRLPAFHDTVLQLGSVPLAVLDRRIDQFIAEGGHSPYASDG